MNITTGCGDTNNAPITLNSGCPDISGCPPGVCPDYVIKRHTTTPAFKVAVEDCDGPIELRGANIIVEANMWARARLKHKVNYTHEYLTFADNIGFYQVMVNDIIIMDRIRAPEHMLVVGFDEENKTVKVQRGYNGTQVCSWSKGSRLRIFKFMNAPASIEILQIDETTPDGRTIPDVTTDTFLVYEWTPPDTCLPGCYWLEFKVFEMEESPHGHSGHEHDHKHESQKDNLILNNDEYYEQEITYPELIDLDYDRIVRDELEYEQGHSPTKDWRHEQHEDIGKLPHHDQEYLPEEPIITEDKYMDGFKNGWHQGVRSGENESLDTNFQAWVLQKQREYEKWADEARRKEEELRKLDRHGDGKIVLPNVISYISTDIYHCNPLGVKWVRKFPLESEGFLIQITNSATEI